MRNLGGTLATFGTALVVGAFWWWALLGLDEKIGNAIGVTAAVALTVGLAMIAASDEGDDATDS